MLSFTKSRKAGKTLLQISFFFLLLTQICFAQWVQTNGPAFFQVYALAGTGTNLFAAAQLNDNPNTWGVLRSTNNGDTWAIVNNGLPNTPYWSLSIGDDGTVFLGSGWGRGMFVSTDSGEHWTEANVGLPYDSIQHEYPPISTLFKWGTNMLAAVYPGVFLSSNRGVNWVQIGQFGESERVSSFTSRGEILFAGSIFGMYEGGNVYRTTDGGMNWTEKQSGAGGLLSSFFLPSTNGSITGFVTGSEGTILKTTDGGENWTFKPSGTTESLRSVFFVSPDNSTYTGYSAGNGGTLLKSTDGGETWFPLNSGTTNDLLSIFFIDANTGIAAGIGVMLKTVDAGITWTLVPSGSNYFLDGLQFIPTGPGTYIGYAVGYFGSILKSTDKGSTWNDVMPKTQNNLRSVFLFPTTDGDFTGYMVGGNGTILSTNPGGTVNVPKLPIVESCFTLYPNPATDQIMVRSKNSLCYDILVSIFNSQGMKVLMKKFQGKETISVCTESFPPGVYFVTIQTKNQLEAKKLVIE
ncbi:MAG: T9SS type A sorting domain-containing protein [Anaerolineaceae bacterium]|nr:T9SS type A sorting domain-containing protein [Anaerolineaceae bacterium]